MATAYKRSRCSRVHVSPHARERFQERHGQGALTSDRVMGVLRNVLALGANPVDLVVQVPIGGLIALCQPLTGDEGGGWLCFTVVEAGWEVV